VSALSAADAEAAYLELARHVLGFIGKFAKVTSISSSLYR
jgi:hypothetical protein